MKITFTSLLLFLAILGQGQTNLEFGQALYGELSTVNQINTYQFDANLGDRIYIRMRDAETAVDACFKFYGPNGQLISNPCGDGGIVSIKDFLIETAGTYTIEAYDANQNDTGAYGISLYLLNAPDYAKPIECGYDGEQTISVTTEINSYTFTADEGDKLLARMRGENGSFESELELYDAAGNLLIAEYGSGLTVLDGYEIPATGTYTLLSDDRNGNDLSLYGLSIQMLNRQDCARSIDCGDNTTGAISTLAGIEAYSFKLDGDAPAFAQARSTNTSFETQLIIYDDQGTELAITEGSSKLQTIVSQLPQGDYLLLAIDEGGNDKADYGISLQFLGDQNCAQRIFCPNSSTEISFETLAASSAFTYSCAAGSIVTPEAYAHSEHLDPEILIYDENANLIEEGYSFSYTSLSEVTMTEGGNYYVILRDWHGNDLGDLKFSIVSDAFNNNTPEFDNPELPTITAECEATVSRPTATDPCEGAIYGTTSAPIKYTEQGEYEIIWTYENSHGVVAQQQQTVIIKDTEAPVINCDEVISFQLSENGEFFLSEADIDFLVKDNCTGIAWTEFDNQYFDCSMVGEHSVTLWTADNAGNETSCKIKINIESNEACAPSCGDLPDHWKLYDIGDGHHSQEGSVCYDPTNPTFEVTSHGEDIFGRHDEFTYVYKEICGSSVIQAKVSDLSSNAGYALAGIMMRNGNHSGDIYAALLASPEKGVFYQTRQKKNQHTLFEAHEGTAPVWIKLVRINKLISGYISKDAVEWELACEIDVKLDECYEIGIAVSAYDVSQGNTGTLDFVDVYNIESTANSVRPPSTIEMADPCQYEIDDRNQIPDCQRATEEQPSIAVFPNPTIESVTIDGTEFKGSSVTITIIDRIGKVHFRGRYDQAPASLPINLKKLKMPNGLYTVVINDGDNVATENFLILDEG